MKVNMPAQSLFFHLEKTIKTLKEHTSKEFKKHQFPVTKDQWLILQRIAEEDICNQKEIADSTLKDPAALTRILDILVIKGFVKRRISLKDRRTFEIILTVIGKRLVDKITPVVQKINQKALQGITTKDAEKVMTILGTIQKNLN